MARRYNKINNKRLIKHEYGSVATAELGGSDYGQIGVSGLSGAASGFATAGPIGAVVGGATGLVTGFFGAKAKAKQRAAAANIKRQRVIANINSRQESDAIGSNDINQSNSIFANGGITRRYGAGGNMQQTSSNTETAVGPIHEEGGIQYTDKDEIEGGETTMKTNDGTNIYSDRLLVPGTDKTFAQHSEPLMITKGKLEKSFIANEGRINKELKTVSNPKSNRLVVNGATRRAEIKSKKTNAIAAQIAEIDTELQSLFELQEQVNGNAENPDEGQSEFGEGGTVHRDVKKLSRVFPHGYGVKDGFLYNKDSMGNIQKSQDKFQYLKDVAMSNEDPDFNNTPPIKKPDLNIDKTLLKSKDRNPNSEYEKYMMDNAYEGRMERRDIASNTSIRRHGYGNILFDEKSISDTINQPTGFNTTSNVSLSTGSDTKGLIGDSTGSSTKSKGFSIDANGLASGVGMAADLVGNIMASNDMDNLSTPQRSIISAPRINANFDNSEELAQINNTIGSAKKFINSNVKNPIVRRNLMLQTMNKANESKNASFARRRNMERDANNKNIGSMYQASRENANSMYLNNVDKYNTSMNTATRRSQIGTDLSNKIGEFNQNRQAEIRDRTSMELVGLGQPRGVREDIRSIIDRNYKPRRLQLWR